MGFRKSAQARIFVDETIPSFLKSKPENRFSAPSLVPPASPAPPLPAQPAPQKPEASSSTDRRQQPLQIRPSFMLKAVSIAIVLNAALYVTFQSPLLYRQTLSMQSEHLHLATGPLTNPHAPVVSYRYSNQELVETP